MFIMQFGPVPKPYSMLRCLSVQDVLLYPNYSIYDTPLANIYGSNLLRLWVLHLKVDPHNVMALAGGWKF